MKEDKEKVHVNENFLHSDSQAKSYEEDKYIHHHALLMNEEDQQRMDFTDKHILNTLKRISKKQNWEVTQCQKAYNISKEKRSPS